MIDALKKHYSIQYMTDVDVVLLPTEKEEPKPTLWYPDDSGEWIECDGTKPNDLREDSMVEVLYEVERSEKYWNYHIDEVRYWDWRHVVAYKVVEKVD